MPTDNTFSVLVYYHTDAEREQAVQLLNEIDKDTVQIYNGSISGTADASIAAKLREANLLVMIMQQDRSCVFVDPAHRQAGVESAYPVAESAPPPAAAEEALDTAATPGPEQANAEFASEAMFESFRPDSAPTAELAEASAPDGGALPTATPSFEVAVPETATAATSASAAFEISTPVDPNGFTPPQPDAAALQDALQRLDTEGEAFRLANPPPATPRLLSSPPEPPKQMFNVQLRLPSQPQWRTELQKIGSGVLSSVQTNLFRMFLTENELAQVKALPFVANVERYSIADTVTPEILDLFLPPAGASDPDGGALESFSPTTPETPKEQTFDVLLHRTEDHQKIHQLIEHIGGVVVDESPGTLRFKAAADAGMLGMLSDTPEVRKIAPYRPPRLYVDHARRLVGIDAINPTPAPGAPEKYTGKGTLVAIFDSGIDITHPDLSDQIQCLFPYRSAPVEDKVGHGTHVAGIIAGTGTASNGKIRGIAPGVKLLIVGMVSEEGELLIPPDVGELLKEATDRGANIINLSWGDKFGSAYEFGSLHLDRFVYAHEDVLVVVAAGNSGTVSSGRYAFSSIGTPATAKNGLTVGAVGSDRTDIPNLWSDSPWYFAAPLGSFLMCSMDIPAVLSSRGPTDYNSVKPDVCACGVFVASARAANGQMPYWAPPFDQFDKKYAYLGGTSMAAPVVAGAAAVLREYLQKELAIASPSAALLKSILIASARRMPGFTPETGEPLAAKVGYPDFHQGFGRIDLSNVLPHPQAPAGRRLLCADVRNGTPEALQAQAPVGDTHVAIRTYTVEVAPNATDPLRIVLTWTDYPGKFLHNNLQLYVQGPGLVLVGNEDLVYQRDIFQLDALAHGGGPPGAVLEQLPFDKYNNVEYVSVNSPPPGTYRISILAQYTDPEHPAQGYGLCVSGELVNDKLTAS